MTRKFNNQSSNKKQSGSYNNNASQKSTKISKQTKKDTKPSQQPSKPQSSTTTALQKPSISMPPPPPPKPLTEASKNNLAKVANINKLMSMGLGLPSSGSAAPVKSNEAANNVSTVPSKSNIKKPSVQQINTALECLKDLQKLLDSYEELQMDENCNLKGFLEFIEAKKINNEVQVQEKVGQ